VKSGFLIHVGDADGDDFDKQVLDAQAFLSEHSSALIDAAGTQGFGGAQLDFGVWAEPPAFSRSFTFPLPLLALASTCGIKLTVSVYFGSDA
jgi:hypothetical protein